MKAWLCEDKDGSVWLSLNKPYKDKENGIWTYDDANRCMIRLDNVEQFHLSPNITPKWDNEEPIEVVLLIDGKTNFKAVKNFIINDVGISKEMIRDMIAEEVKRQVGEIIYGTYSSCLQKAISDEIRRKVASNLVNKELLYKNLDIRISLKNENENV